MNIEIQPDRRTETAEDGTEREWDYRQNKILVDGRWFAVAGYPPGSAVAFLRTAVPRATLGNVARALDEHDGMPCPTRELHVPGGPTVMAREVVKYGD